MRKRIRTRLFGNATGKQVLARVCVDFIVANLVLVAAAVLRLLLTAQLNFDNPVDQLVGKINAVYLLHASWFAATAVVLFALAGLYHPVPSSRIRSRLVNIGSACVAGFCLQIAFGGLIQNKLAATLEVAVSAWLFLGLATFALRVSRMSLAQHFRVVPRNRNPKSNHVELVLVVGGAGYIGSVLTEQLLQKGYRVRILDMELFGRDSIESLLKHPRLEMMVGDFRNIEHVVRALHNVDAVVHLAAIVGDPACALDGEATIAVNYAAAKVMATLARANGISRFVFASTCSVYGESDELRTEESELNPVSLYATTKIDAEKALLESADGVFRPTILRFATAYGWSRRPRFDLVANLFSAQAVTDKHIRVFNGEQWRPFVHTWDIARACVMAIEAPIKKVSCQIFNVGDQSQNYTLTQLGQIVGQCMPGTFVEEIRNNDDLRNYRVDFSKIQKTLGFQASVKLEDGIQEMVNAVKEGKVRDWTDPIYSNFKTLQGEGLRILKFEKPENNEEELAVTRRFLAKVA